MNNNKMSVVMLNYRPYGRRSLGSPLKTLLDKAGTGLLRPTSWRMMMVIKIKYLLLSKKVSLFLTIFSYSRCRWPRSQCHGSAAVRLWYCEFESLRSWGMDVCLLRVLCVARKRFLRLTDPSTRGVLPIAACLSMI